MEHSVLDQISEGIFYKNKSDNLNVIICVTKSQVYLNRHMEAYNTYSFNHKL